MKLNDWLQVDKTSGEGNATITLTANENNKLVDRNVSLIIKTSKKNVIMNIFQKYEVFKLSETLVSCEWTGGTRIVELETNRNDLVFEKPDWLYDLYYYNNGDVINCVLTFKENSSTNRFGEVLIKVKNTNIILGSIVIAQGSSGYENRVIYYASTNDEPTISNDDGVIGNQFEYVTSNGLKVGCVYFDDVIEEVPYSLFFGDNGLQAVSVPPTVTSIDSEAFYFCENLNSFCDYDNITSIGEHAFDGCTSLKRFDFTSSMTSIGDYAFRKCGFKKVELYENGAVLGEYVFSGCTDLLSIVILPSTDVKPIISNNTFNGVSEGGLLEYPLNADYDDWLSKDEYYLGYYKWTDLSEGDEPDEPVVTIPNNEIHYTSTDGNIVEPNSSVFGVTIKSNTYKDGIGIITFYGDVTKIGDRAFILRDSLLSISIPDSVTKIGENAFYGCDSLTSITIGSSVIRVLDSAFEACYSLTSITCKALFAPTIGSKTFQSVKSNGTLYYPQGSDYSDWLSTDKYYLGYYKWNGLHNDYVVPNNKIYYKSQLEKVVTPSESALFGANIVSNTYENSIGIITFDGDVTEIGEYAFSSKGITKIFIPNSVTKIGDYAFKGTKLFRILIPDNVTEIGTMAFGECELLISITIGSSVKLIKGSAFLDCEALETITCKATTAPTIYNDTFKGINPIYDIKYQGIVYHPIGSDYSSWFSTDAYYLGYYGWKGSSY